MSCCKNQRALPHTCEQNTSSLFTRLLLLSLFPLTAEHGMQMLFDAAYVGMSEDFIKTASREERIEEELLTDSKLTYGEATFESFAVILEKIRPLLQLQAADTWPEMGNPSEPASRRPLTFVDLGSGAGKPCIAAALLGDFAKCVGIECLRSLNALSEVRGGRVKECRKDGMVE